MRTKNLNLMMTTSVLMTCWLLAGLVGPASAGQAQTAQNPDATVSPAPPPGEVWVYPTGVFPDDFYALWLAVNGAPYVSGDLPFPFPDATDTQPETRPVYAGQTLPNRDWTVVLKARRLDACEGDEYVEGPFTAFNLGLAAGTQLIKKDPVAPVNYMLTREEQRFSTGFGDVVLRRPVEIVGELTPGGEEEFFGYTPNFDPAANPDTNPQFDADWLPADYPRGSEYEPGLGHGVWSSKSVVYGGWAAFHVRPVKADLSVSDCLLYGQYGSGIRTDSAPSRTLISNVDIRHTYHLHSLGADHTIGMFTHAIRIQGDLGSGGKHLIEGCTIDQGPTWQEYYFGRNPKQQRYKIEPMPGGHAVSVYGVSKEDPDDFVRIENCTMRNCGSNCIVSDGASVDLRIADCLIDGGHFPITPTNQSKFPDWRGNCIYIGLPTLDPWDSPPAIDIVGNRLIARGWSAWGVRLFGCGNGEVTVEDNTITCASASPAGDAGGVQLCPSDGIGSSGNLIADNTIEGTGGWAISVDAFDESAPCEGNEFLDNDLSGFSTEFPGAVFFGPYANYNFFSGDVGAGVVDLGTGNVVE